MRRPPRRRRLGEAFLRPPPLLLAVVVASSSPLAPAPAAAVAVAAAAAAASGGQAPLAPDRRHLSGPPAAAAAAPGAKPPPAVAANPLIPPWGPKGAGLKLAAARGLLARLPETLASPEGQALARELERLEAESDSSQGGGAGQPAAAGAPPRLSLVASTPDGGHRGPPPGGRPAAGGGLMRREVAAAPVAAGHAEASGHGGGGGGGGGGGFAELGTRRGAEPPGHGSGGVAEAPVPPVGSTDDAGIGPQPSQKGDDDGKKVYPVDTLNQPYQSNDNFEKLPHETIQDVNATEFHSSHELFVPPEGTTLPPPWWKSLPEYTDDLVHGVDEEVEVPRYEFWIEDGCRYGPGEPLQGNYSFADVKVAKVQCCTTGQGTECLREMEGKCLVEELVTHDEAVEVCHTNNMRLCSRKELRDSRDALGCCGSGCELDDHFVWTSTHSLRSLILLNRNLTEEVNEKRKENLHLLQEHLSEELRLNHLKSTLTPDMTFTTTVPWLGVTNKEVDGVINRNKRLKKQYDLLKRENEMLRRRLLDTLHWSEFHRIYAPSWQYVPEYYQPLRGNRTWKPTPEHWYDLPDFNLSWIHHYHERDLGWRWSTTTTTPWSRYYKDDKYHGRLASNVDIWPPYDHPGEPDSEFWPVEKPGTTTPTPPRPEWLPQPESRGHLEYYDAAKHHGFFQRRRRTPLWDRYR